jgi:hypothetical protein
MITLIYIWRIEKKNIAGAILRMATQRRPLRNNPAISFFKLLGTGTGESFTPRDADPLTWALLVTLEENQVAQFDQDKVVQSWRSIATNELRLTASPISAHGLWSKKQPFEIKKEGERANDGSWDGKIVAITRARISWLKNMAFWRAVPPVIESLRQSDGLELAIGIGEAPVGLQGTLSIWRDSQSLRTFAYKGDEHKAVIERTHSENWYSEELFARFALLELRGNLPFHE